MTAHRAAPTNRLLRSSGLSRLALFGLLALFPGCVREQPVRLGFLGGLTGKLSDLGVPGRDAAILAVEEANRGGGAGGRRVELLVRDDRQDPAAARAAVQELLDAGVLAIVGPMTSAVAVAVVDPLEARGVPAVSPTVSTSDLAGRDDHFLRVFPTTDENARGLARYVLGRPGPRRLGLVYDGANRAYTENWYRAFASEFEAGGGTVVASLGFHSAQDLSFAALVESVIEAGPEGVVLVASALDAALLAQQLVRIHPGLKLFACEWSGTEHLLEYGGHAVDGMVFPSVFPEWSREPRYLAFRDRYRERFGRYPDFAAVAAYDAASAVLRALGEHRPGEPVKDALLRLHTFSGLHGDFSLDRYGDVQRRHTLTAVRDGRFQEAR